MPDKLQESMFNLSFAAKQLARESKRCEKEEKAEKLKLKRAIQKNNMEGARIHAENAIRQKNQALNFLRMSARVDAVSSRVKTAMSMKSVTKNMSGVVKSMEGAMKSMNLEKIAEVMDRFEKQFENLDVQSQYMESAMTSSTTQFTPEDQVNSLMHQAADEAGLELNMELPGAGSASLTTSVASNEQDELSQRLARLRDT